MSVFFGISAVASSLAYLAAVVLGRFHLELGLSSQQHLMVGMIAGISMVFLHCLVFAIFTGSGKDTRLLVEDLDLDAEFVKTTKGFKHQIFPPALYAIFWILITVGFGGALSLMNAWYLRWAHLILALFTFYYNAKTFWLEYRGIRMNSQLLKQLNEKASAAVVAPTQTRELKILESAAEDYDWGTHVYALGRFLCFLGYNAWMPYIYLRFIVGNLSTPVWPFGIASVSLILSGVFLKLRYGEFVPKHGG